MPEAGLLARRLLVVSHTPHHRRADGVIVGWGATVRELDRLATLFEELVHVAPLYEGPPAASDRAYRASNVRVRTLAPSGGSGLAAKVGILLRWPGYLTAILSEARQADAVHVRAPANIALLAMTALGVGGSLGWPRRPWWAKYAGNWRPEGEEPTSYRWQRRWLARGWPGLRTTVNGRWPDDGPHITPFFNPCLSDEELTRARQAAEAKPSPLPPSLPVRLLFVGRLDALKGAGRVLALLAHLRSSGIDVQLELAGDGPERSDFEAQAAALGVEDSAVFHGWASRDELDEAYARAHFLVLPSRSSEGFPKVLSEAMAHGAVPLAADVSSIPQILGDLEVGEAIPSNTSDDVMIEAMAAAILRRLEDPAVWRLESRKASQQAEHFTYERYLQAVRDLFGEVSLRRTT